MERDLYKFNDLRSLSKDFSGHIDSINTLKINLGGLLEQMMIPSFMQQI